MSNISFMEIISFGSSHTDDTFSLAAADVSEKINNINFFMELEAIIMDKNMKQDLHRLVWLGSNVWGVRCVWGN